MSSNFECQILSDFQCHPLRGLNLGNASSIPFGSMAMDTSDWNPRWVPHDFHYMDRKRHQLRRRKGNTVYAIFDRFRLTLTYSDRWNSNLLISFNSRSIVWYCSHSLHNLNHEKQIVWSSFGSASTVSVHMVRVVAIAIFGLSQIGWPLERSLATVGGGHLYN